MNLLFIRALIKFNYCSLESFFTETESIDMAYFVIVCLILIAVSSEINAATSCADVSTSGLPCIDVPLCSLNKPGQLTVNKLSNGLGKSKASSVVDICYDEKSIKIKYSSYKQQYFSDHVYGDCNDGVFNSDVAEVFIAPFLKGEVAPHCYSEIDVNPFNKIFESGIYNPNLSKSGISGYVLDCATSGVTHSTKIDRGSSSWVEDLSIPWSVVDFPNCPNSNASAGTQQNNLRSSTTAKGPAHTVYRANFFRVNELTAVSTCSSSTCEYMAWSPTGVNPPAFHEPTKFGYLVLAK